MTIQQKTIELIKSGDKNAFKEFFEVLFHPLCAFGYKYVSDHSAVEDMVQEAFTTFWEKRNDFDHPNTIKTFLYTSVRNKCLNHLKHQSIRSTNEDGLIYQLESDHYYVSQVVEEEAFSLLYNEIKHLPESSQKVMLLALKGLKNKEIAEELSISENTVKTQKKIAYSKLKRKLSPTLNTILLSL